MTEIAARHGRPEDVDALGRIHAEAFQGYFLTQLGHPFLRRYYRAFVNAPHTLVVGTIDGRAVGFVAGTTDLARFRRDLYPPNLLPFAWIVLGKLVSDGAVRRQIWRRIHHVPLAIKAVVARRRGTDTVAPEADPMSVLFSIGVSPESRGSGVADEMMRAYLAAERSNGATKVHLSVIADNDRAIAFYERGGWREVSREDGVIALELDLT